MEELSDDLNIYREEVRDILSDPPKTILKWGNTILLVFLILLFFISWFIKYPDIVTSQIIITTSVPPEKLIAKTTGKIEVILVEDRAIITKNTPLAVIENSANYKDVFLLKSIVDTITFDKSKFPFEKLKSVQLGEVESSFTVFLKEYSTEELNTKLQPFKIEGRAQKYEAIQLKVRLDLLESKKNINQSELQLQKNDLERHEILYGKGVISTQELEKQRLQYLQAQKNFKNILSDISQIKSFLNEISRNTAATQINESKEDLNLELNVIRAFYQLRKAIKDWELNYVFRAGIDGKVAFLQIWSKNQTVNVGENVFAIIPNIENGYIGKVKAKALNSGKIKIGQTVNIKLLNYPEREFGILKGTVKVISLTPDKDGNLLIDISLYRGLETFHKKKIVFLQEMVGTADIITEDLRLIERLLYQFRDIFNR